jgi:ferritin-like metal-binding protein YciE
MKEITTLRDLLVQQTQHLYDSEKQQLDALPEIKAKVNSAELKQIINKHIETTKKQVRQLDNIFKEMNEKSREGKCESMRGLINEGMELAKRCSDPEVMDAGIINSIQHIEHCEIAGYGTAAAYAETLGMMKVAELYYGILEEEKKYDKELSHLAETKINLKAKSPIVA